jgi:ABC-type lipoprotein release transport system permease subunit
MTHASILVRLAMRNVVRQRRRSVLIALAMMFGVALLIVFLAVGDGTHAQWIDAGVRLSGGHVSVETAAFRRSTSLDDRLDSVATSRVLRAIAAPGVARYTDAAAPRIAVSALASSASSALPVQVLGVDPAAESAFSLLPAKLTSGTFLTGTASTDAVVGQGLVDRLGLRMGSRFVIAAQTAAGDVEEQLLRVTGIFRTGIREVDEGLVDIPLATARRWLATPGAVTSVAILLRDGQDVPAAVRNLRPLLPASTVPFTWRETSPELDAAVRIDNVGSYLFNAILLAIVALAVLEALLVSVLHRRREFGVMRALGLSARETSLVVLVEGVMLAVASGTLGLALGFGVVSALGHTGLDLSAALGDQLTISGSIVSPVIYPVVHAARVWQGVVVVLALGALSSLYPMWQATRIDVAAAMQVDQ